MEVKNQNTVKDDVPVSSKFKWRIEKVPELNERLAVFRRDINGDDYLSIYVVAVECTNSRYAKFSFAIIGQTNKPFNKDTEDQLIHFTDEEDDWGFDDFILFDELIDPSNGHEEDDWGFDDFILFDELIDPSNGHMVDDACIIEIELCSFSKPESTEVTSQRPCSISTKSRKEVAVEGEKAVGGGEILDGKEVAEIGKENKRIIEEGTSDIDCEKQPAKKAKIPLKKKDSKANEGEVISQSTKGSTFRAGFTPLWSLINRIYQKEKLSFSEEQLGLIQNSPFGYIFMAFHETRNTKEQPCKTHSKNHWTKGNEYKLRSKSEQLVVIFRIEFYLTYFGSSTVITKGMLENSIVGLVKSGEKNEDLVKMIGLFMCETLFFITHAGSHLNKKYLKLFDRPWKTNSLSWPDLVQDHLMASLNKHKDTTLVTGCIWSSEHIKSGVKETPIAEGLPRFARWNIHNICSVILTDFESLEISEGFIEANTEVEKQALNSLRMRIHQQDQPLFCEAGEGQPQQNELIMQKEVRSTVQGDRGVGNVDQEQLLIQQNKYDDLRMSVKRRWDAKEKKKLNGKTVHYEVEELLNEFYFKAYPDEKKRKRKLKFVSAIYK
ncbi:hypothetical protein MKW98_005308 [Papaver atlanticum]|uniref:MATH domain-containing protein n=1 Tax=Papaver atlanticum TaxID=357466 RepID=A0AAD4X3T7_9MAGN|nr:hypothetical protein MKW98_005308 [Papaver atlanticum]